MIAFLRRWIPFAWALPTTAPFLALACVGTTIPTFRAEEGAFVAYSRSTGPWAWFFRRFGMAAVTPGVLIVMDPREASNRLFAHERAHVRQARGLGPFYLPAYLFSSFAVWACGGDAYRDNAFEVEARKAAGDRS